MKKYFYAFESTIAIFLFICGVSSLLACIFYGYIHNLLNLYNSQLSMTGKCILQIIGVICPPLGVLLGWFT
jgi:hypothetical protein